MASITKRYRKTADGEKIVGSWDIRTAKINGRTLTFCCSSAFYSEADAIRRREIIEYIEIAKAKGRPYSDALEEIRALGDARFVAWLEKNGIVSTAKVLSFEGLLERALEGFEALGDKPQSIDEIERSAKQFQSYLDKLGINPPVSQIDKSLAREFWAWICARDKESGRKPSTTNQDLTHIKQVFNWGLKLLDELKENPFNCLEKRPDNRPKENTTLNEEQIAKILDVLERSKKPRFWTAWFLLGVRQGLRIFSEAPALKWEFIDFKAGRIMILDRKRSKRGKVVFRVMPLRPQTAEALKKIKEEQKRLGVETRGYIFPELSQIQRTTLHAQFQTILRSNGLDYKDAAGTLRRTAANWWREKVGEFWENMFLGHSSDVARTHYYDPYSIPASIMDEFKESEKEIKPEQAAV